ASIVKNMFDETQYEIDYQFGYCNLPSTTEENSDFYKNRNNETYYELDKWKHSENNYPNNIVGELDILNKLKDKIISLANENKKVIVASDHGTSRLAVLSRKYTFDSKEGAKRYRFGRYCIDEKNDYSEIKGCINKDNFWIFANYHRFAEHGAPSGEIHGGASLEEMIVPVFSICKRNINDKKVKKESNSIILLTKEIKMPLNHIVNVKFKLNEQLLSVVAIVGAKRFECELKNGEYSFEQKIGTIETNDEYTARIISLGNEIGEIKYKIIKGITMNLEI
ncbi:MAG: BREX-4 system phosphatase PglZ, partial [Clostridia bacterium]|nr:BREX-4 system phosphatase PglZ [Clostridia bacterium]